MARPTKIQGSRHLYARKVVPKELRGILGRSEFKRPLRGTSDAEIKRDHAAALAEWEAAIAAARAGQHVATCRPSPSRTIGTITPASSAPIPAALEAPKADPLAAATLMEAWARERNPAPNTLRKYRIAFSHVARLVGFDDLRRITEDDVVRFKAARLGEGRTPGTVADDVLACNAVCAWGVKNRLLSSNPFRGLAPTPKDRQESSREPFTDEEAAAILIAARRETGWLRWLPWLLAFTGARISEITEMRRGDVREDSGVWILDIRPVPGRAGKNKTFQRKIPIHPAVIAEDFLQYLADLPPDLDGPLFPSLAVAPDGTRSTTAKNKHGRWLRQVVGIKREGIAPAHSWRHWMEDALRKVEGVKDEVVDAITGRNNPRNSGARYGRGFRNMPDETINYLQRVPSPVAKPNVPASGSASPTHVSIDDAVRGWFDVELDRAARVVAAAEAIIDPRDRKRQLALIEREAADRIDVLVEERDAREIYQGDWLAVSVAKTMESPPEPGSAAFRSLRAVMLRAEGLVAEAAMRWAAGDDRYWPVCPTANQAGEAV